MIRVIYVLVVHFILSLHNGWIQPRLRLYDQGRHQRDQARSRQQLQSDIRATEAVAGRGAAAAGQPAAEAAPMANEGENRAAEAQAAPMNTELRNIINNTIEDIDIIDLAGPEDEAPDSEEQAEEDDGLDDKDDNPAKELPEQVSLPKEIDAIKADADEEIKLIEQNDESPAPAQMIDHKSSLADLKIDATRKISLSASDLPAETPIDYKELDMDDILFGNL